MPRILIVEDDPDAAAALRHCAATIGFSVTVVTDRAAARAELLSQAFDVLALDMFLPDGTAFDILLEADSPVRDCHILLMTGDRDALKAFSKGSFRSMHFLTKPIDFATLDGLLRQLLALCGGAGEDDDGPRGVDRLIGTSSAMDHVRNLIRRIAPSELTVCIEGESGTGKEVVAQAIHEASTRSGGPFIAVNCGSIPSTLIDSELFGHQKGAFTGADATKQGVFEAANGGTLFLDEVAEMPVELQVRLLRALENSRIRRVGGKAEIPVDVRIISATNRDFARAIDEGTFREDLFYRLNVVPITLPPLRVRDADVIELAEHFLAEYRRKDPRPLDLSPSARQALIEASFPGNVRQLRNVVQRACVLADRVIEAKHIKLDDLRVPEQRTTARAGSVAISVGETIAEAERKLILATLDRFRGNRRETADALGISLRTLYNRLGDYSAEAVED